MSGQFERRLTALEAVSDGSAAVRIVVQEPGESLTAAIERRYPDGVSARDRLLVVDTGVRRCPEGQD